MQCIVFNLITKGKLSDFPHISHFTPFFDIFRTWDNPKSLSGLQELYQRNHELIGCHVFNTHFLFDMLPQQPNMKYIYVIRDGKDAAVSFYHHLSNQMDDDQFQGSFDEFLQLFLEGKLPYGSRAKHVYDWWKVNQKLETPRIHFVRYEDLLSNTKFEIQRLIRYLELIYTEEEIESILPLITFSYMKSHKEQYEPISVPWKAGFQFLREGKTGDSNNLFSEKNHEYYDNFLRVEWGEILSNENNPILNQFIGF
jgi:hypothetical protein